MTENTVTKKPVRKRAPRKAAAKPAEQPAEQAAAPLTDTLALELTSTLPNGIIVPTTLSITYPQGMGLHAVSGVQKLMAEQAMQLYQELANRNDGSMIQALLAQREADQTPDA